MGIFNEVRVELPLKKYDKGSVFQTKSFETLSLFSTYVITQSGELYCESWDYEWVEDKNDISFFKGYMKKIDGSYRREYLTDFHGDVILYDSSDYEYIVRFTYGKVDRITFKTRERLNAAPIHERPTIRE